MNPFGEGMRLRFGSAVFLSTLALGIMFWGLFQVDLPFARFLRSVHLTWLEQTGDLGTRLGSGAMLVSLSVALLLAGFALKRPRVFEAGWQKFACAWTGGSRGSVVETHHRAAAPPLHARR